ncbi:Hypothetical protein, putative [Bodo saltans]|uniref:Uncharacterized protein n=1 Tax=Bodo saltans TaxID=75058 RepID=A0A0S4KHV9_BODSA|nr:Hypothetical protein, putative [Bodo saltans]|eukprot:CUI14104.1 Hypothetical protein, putative [Bodo saltans]
MQQVGAAKAVEDINRIAPRLFDCLQSVRSLVNVTLKDFTTAPTRELSQRLLNIETLLIHTAWVLDASCSIVHDLLHLLPPAGQSGRNDSEASTTTESNIEEVAHVIDTLLQHTTGMILRLHARIGNQPGAADETSQATNDTDGQPPSDQNRKPGRRRRGPDASERPKRIETSEPDATNGSHKVAVSESWLVGVVDILALGLSAGRRRASLIQRTPSENVPFPSAMRQGMEELSLCVRNVKCELRVAKMVLRMLLTASSGGAASLSKSNDSTLLLIQRDHPFLVQRLQCVLAEGEKSTQQLVHRALWVASQPNTSDAKVMSIALRTVSEAAHPKGAYHVAETEQREAFTSQALLAFVGAALHGLRPQGLDRGELIMLPKGDLSNLLTIASSLTNTMLSPQWYHHDRVLKFVAITAPILSLEVTRVSLPGNVEGPSRVAAGTTAVSTQSSSLLAATAARRIVDHLLARGGPLAAERNNDKPRWHDALRVVEMIVPQVRESIAADLQQKDEHGRLIAIALRNNNSNPLSKNASRRLRRALDERLRIDILEDLERLRRNHQWKEAISIYRDYGIQMIRSGGASAFAFAAARHPPFAEEIVSQLEAYGGTCSSVGTAALAASVRIWKERDSSSDMNDVSSAVKSLASSQDVAAPSHLDRETTDAIFKHRAKLCASMALAVLQRPIQGDLLPKVTSSVMELLESDEVTAVTFLQQHGVMDEAALRDARDALDRSLDLGFSVKDPYHQFRRLFPGCQPSKASFMTIADRLLQEFLLDDHAVSSFLSASCQLLQNADYQWCQPIPFVASTRLKSPNALTAVNLLVDAASWNWSCDVLRLVEKCLLTAPSNAVANGYGVITIMWCHLLANEREFPRSQLVQMLPSVFRVLSAVKARCLAPHALVVNPLEGYHNKWRCVAEIIPHYAALVVSDLVKQRLRPLWHEMIPTTVTLSSGIMKQCDHHTVWMYLRRTWLDLFLPLKTELQEYHSTLLHHMDGCWESTRTTLASTVPQQLDEDMIQNIRDEHVVHLDVWAACFLRRLNATASFKTMNFQSTFSVCRVQRELATQLRQVVRRLETTIRAHMPNDFSVWYLALLVQTWLPLVLHCASEMWFQCIRWEARCGGANVVDPTTCRLLSRSELLDVLKDISDTRWDLTNMMKEIALTTKLVATHAALHLRAHPNTVDGLHSEAIRNAMCAAHEVSLRLLAMSIRYVRNPQQLDVTRRAVESVAFSTQAFAPNESMHHRAKEVHHANNGNDASLLLATSVCHLLFSSTPTQQVEGNMTHQDAERAALQKLHRVLTTCNSHMKSARGTRDMPLTAALMERQAIHVIEAFAIYLHTLGEEVSSAGAEAVVDSVSRFLSVVGDAGISVSPAGDDGDDAKRVAARWLLYRFTGLGVFTASSHHNEPTSISCSALSKHLSSMVACEDAVRSSFSIASLQAAVGKIGLGTFLVSPICLPTDAVGSISDILMANVVNEQWKYDRVTTPGGDDPVISLLTTLSRGDLVHRWDLAAGLNFGWCGVAPAITAAQIPCHKSSVPRCVAASRGECTDTLHWMAQCCSHAIVAWCGTTAHARCRASDCTITVRRSTTTGGVRATRATRGSSCYIWP